MNDQEEIFNTALGYIESWYSGDREIMSRVLSDHLIKRRLTPENTIWKVDKDWMVNAVSEGRGCIDDPINGRKEITILDKTARMCSVKIISNEFIDYLHLIKSDGIWKIMDVLWDYAETE